MASLRNSAACEESVRRIQALRAGQAPQWGKMNAAQMLTHCQRPLRVAAGEMVLKRGLIGFLFGGMAKKRFIVSDTPFGKNSPTDPKFIVKGQHDFAAEQATLIELVQVFSEKGPVTRGPHPFFGPLTEGEWDRLMWKHLDHHLRQFGV